MVLGLGGTMPHGALFGVVSLGRVTGCSLGSLNHPSGPFPLPVNALAQSGGLQVPLTPPPSGDLPSRMYAMMKNMFVRVFQGWALDVQPNISEHGVHEDPSGCLLQVSLVTRTKALPGRHRLANHAHSMRTSSG